MFLCVIAGIVKVEVVVSVSVKGNVIGKVKVKAVVSWWVM